MCRDECPPVVLDYINIRLRGNYRGTKRLLSTRQVPRAFKHVSGGYVLSHLTSLFKSIDFIIQGDSVYLHHLRNSGSSCQLLDCTDNIWKTKKKHITQEATHE